MSKARLVITAVTVEKRSVSEVARSYGVARSWIYALLARQRAEGEAAFEPRSKRPKTSPAAIPDSAVELIVLLRKELAGRGLDAGPDTIAWHLAHHHRVKVSPATISRYLARAGLVVPEPRKRPKSSYLRFEAEQPNECWQSDFTHYPLADGTGTEILTWLDDHSRYALYVRDEHGGPVHLTPHQWRHTFACRLINRDVPQEVVRVLLDHSSTQMTAHYAKITDQTVRRRWEQATRVNINGEPVVIDPAGPLAQAQWAKTRYGIATQTLPNGYCGLPVQRQCPHANACLTCPVFITGPEFLPELREQRHRTLTLITTARGNGHARVTEMNEQVAANLDRMISELETITADGGQEAAGAS